MGLKKILHVNAGDGETSYANNSGLQNIVISKTWPVLDETLKDMFTAHDNGFLKCFKIADLGCASGPNTLSVISYIADTIQDLCTNNNVNNSPPEIEVFLNDLPNNDFNNLFKSLPVFCQKMCKLECFIYGVPGSFYERLFPSNTLHFAYSSYSLHWLSQVPEGLGKNNKENIYIAMTSPPQAFEAYANQFHRDFSRFLSMRGHEIISGGRMVLAFIGRSVVEPSTKDDMLLLTLIGEILFDMVVEGLVNNEDLHSFNMPVYAPCIQEVEAIIISEGSFNLDKVEIVLVPWDANADCNNMAFEKYKSGKLVADCLRAFMESLLGCHFGSSIDIDAVFHRYASKMADHLSAERSSYFTPVISLTRK